MKPRFQEHGLYWATLLTEDCNPLRGIFAVESRQSASLLQTRYGNLRIDVTLPPGTIRFENEHGSVTIHNLQSSEDSAE